MLVVVVRGGERSAASAIRQSGQSRQALQAARLSGGVEELARVGIAHVRQVPRIAHDTWPCAHFLASVISPLILFFYFLGEAHLRRGEIAEARTTQSCAAGFFFWGG